MDDNTLLTIALASAMIGLVALFVMMYFAVIPETPIQQINDSDIGQKISVTGEIKSVRQSNSTTFIKIEQACELDVVVFDKINVTKGNARIIGVVQEYQGKKELIADSITIK